MSKQHYSNQIEGLHMSGWNNLSTCKGKLNKGLGHDSHEATDLGKQVGLGHQEEEEDVTSRVEDNL